MNPLPNPTVWGVAVAVLAVVAAAALGGAPLAIGVAAAALVYVAFAAQSQRLRGEQNLVYRPVYARRQGVQRRVRSDD